MIKDVKGFEDYLQVTDDGRVFTKDRYVLNNGTPVLRKGRELTPTDNGTGYFQVKFQIDGKKYHKYIHRLVAENFLPNPENKSDVNHINGDKSKNNVENLEWVSHSENILHALKTGLLRKDNNGYFASPE